MAGAIRKAYAEWGDSIAARFGGRFTEGENGQFRIFPKEEAVHFASEFHNIWAEMLQSVANKDSCSWWQVVGCETKYPKLAAETKLGFSRASFATILSMGTVEHEVGGRVYRILNENAATAWSSKMQETVAYLNEMEDYLVQLPGSLAAKLDLLVDGVGNFARDVLVEATTTVGSAAGKGVAALVMPLLIPIGLIVGGATLVLVVLSKTGAGGIAKGLVQIGPT